MGFNILNSEEKNIIENKGTELPFFGEYNNFYKEGVFVCRRCNFPYCTNSLSILFISKNKKLPKIIYE